MLMKLMVLGRVSICFYWVLLHFLNLSTAIGSMPVKTIISHKRVLYIDDLGAIVHAFFGNVLMGYPFGQHSEIGRAHV